MDARLSAIRICGRAFSDLVAHLRSLGSSAQSSCSTERDAHAWLEFDCATAGPDGRPLVVSLYMHLGRDPRTVQLDVAQPGGRVSQLFAAGQITRASIVERVAGLYRQWGQAGASNRDAWDVPFADRAA